MTRPRPGGRRRVDKVLAPEFIADLPSLSLDDVRARRREAEQEDADLSFLRRLLQARIDLVRAELAARAGGSGEHLIAAPPSGDAGDAVGDEDDGDAALVARLTKALAGDSSHRGLGRHLVATPSRVDQHRRAPERAWSDIGLSDVDARTDEELESALLRLVEMEAEVSEVRRAVHVVADALSAETGRRYRDGEVDVEATLAGEGGGAALDEEMIEPLPDPHPSDPRATDTSPLDTNPVDANPVDPADGG